MFSLPKAKGAVAEFKWGVRGSEGRRDKPASRPRSGDPHPGQGKGGGPRDQRGRSNRVRASLGQLASALPPTVFLPARLTPSAWSPHDLSIAAVVSASPLDDTWRTSGDVTVRGNGCGRRLKSQITSSYPHRPFVPPPPQAFSGATPYPNHLELTTLQRNADRGRVLSPQVTLDSLT